jgi:hypothetical protein
MELHVGHGTNLLVHDAVTADYAAFLKTAGEIVDKMVSSLLITSA